MKTGYGKGCMCKNCSSLKYQVKITIHDLLGIEKDRNQWKVSKQGGKGWRYEEYPDGTYASM